VRPGLVIVAHVEGRALAIRHPMGSEMLARRLDGAVERCRHHFGTRGTRKIARYVASGTRREAEITRRGGTLQQPAETVNTLDEVPTFEPAESHVVDRDSRSMPRRGALVL